MENSSGYNKNISRESDGILDTMNKFKIILKIVSENWMTLLFFEIFYKILGFSFVFSFVRYLLNFLPQLIGVNYLNQENMGELFRNPLAVLFSLFILVLSVLYTTCEITAFMVLGEYGWHHKKLSLPQLCKQVLSQTVRLLKPKKIGVFIMLPVLICSVFSPISQYLKNIRVPEFILEFLQDNTVLYGLFIGVLVICHILLLLYIFGFPSMLFEESSFLESWRKSLKLLRRKKGRIAGQIILLTGYFLFLFLLLATAFITILGLYSKLFFVWETGRQLLELYLDRWLRIIQIVGSILTSAFLCGIIIFFYHQCRGEEYQVPQQRKSAETESAKGQTKGFVKIRERLFPILNMILLVCVLLFFNETEIGGAYITSVQNTPIIIAHRAGAAFAPENTLAALSEAIHDGADVVEIDVQQLGDGTLIIMHDTNFKRTAGVDLDIWDADFEMLKNLNVGAGKEAIPTLEEFLSNANGEISVMLELKSSGHEREMERSVLQAINENGMNDQCMIASMNLDILKRVKELDPTMETVYISALLITGQYERNTVDGYSVETTSLSPEMAARAHFQGKKIYGWTANSGYTLKKVLRSGADGIITDNVLYASYFVREHGNNLLVEDIVSLFYGEYDEIGAETL